MKTKLTPLLIAGNITSMVVLAILAVPQLSAANKNVWIYDPVNTLTGDVNMTVAVGADVIFSAETTWPQVSSFTWSGASKLNEVYPTSQAEQVFSACCLPVTVTAAYNGEVSYAATVYPVQLDLDSSEIWWFNGENPGGGYVTSATAHVVGGPPGSTISWAVTPNPGPVIWSGSGDTIQITAESYSGAMNDVTVAATVNGVTLSATLTVLGPKYQILQGNTDNPASNGWQSLISYEIDDQFLNPLPYPVPWNEDIDGNGTQSTAAQVSAAAISDFTGENWGWGDEGSASVDPRNATDDFIRSGSGLTPACQNPQPPLGATKVDHSPGGGWYCGSLTIGKGVKIANTVWQTYTDHGRHQ